MTEHQEYAEYFYALMSKEGLDFHLVDFHICCEVVSPGSRGIYVQNGGWYLYEYDDRCRKRQNGPHTLEVITKFVAIKLQFKDTPKLTEDELEAYIYGSRYV